MKEWAKTRKKQAFIPTRNKTKLRKKRSFFIEKQRIRGAIRRCTAVTLGYVRLSTRPRAVLARLVLLASCTVFPFLYWRRKILATIQHIALKKRPNQVAFSLRRLFIYKLGCCAVCQALFGDDNLFHVLFGRDFVHNFRHYVFDDGTKPTRSRL